MYVPWSSNGMELRDAVVHDNTATAYAGGVYFLEIDATVTRSEFYGNTAPQGGALRIANGAKISFDASSIHDNTASSEGGGIQTYAHYNELYTEIWLTNSAIYDNTSGGWAGGAALYYANTWCLGDSATASGIFGNTAGTDADDVYYYGVNIYGDNQFVADGCDIGDPRDGTDGELYLGGVGAYNLGSDASFTCNGTACY